MLVSQSTSQLCTHLGLRQHGEPVQQALRAEMLNGHRGGTHACATAHLTPKGLVPKEGHRHRGTASCQACSSRACTALDLCWVDSVSCTSW